jgi:hypothetical protein
MCVFSSVCLENGVAPKKMPLKQMEHYFSEFPTFQTSAQCVTPVLAASIPTS